MKNSPIVVEVKVEENGLFVTTTSVLMCATLKDARQAYDNQIEMAKGLMEWQNQDFVSEAKQGNSFFTGVHYASKE